jgi:hypothetical protein
LTTFSNRTVILILFKSFSYSLCETAMRLYSTLILTYLSFCMLALSQEDGFDEGGEAYGGEDGYGSGGMDPYGGMGGMGGMGGGYGGYGGGGYGKK